MIKVENWSDEEIKSYGRLIGEAFAASPGIAEKVPSEYIINAFVFITEFYYKMGVLYATSEKYEGFLGYWDKKTKQPLKYSLQMIFKMMKVVPLKYLLLIGSTSSEQYKKIYRSEADYIAISMVVVLRGYQGKGYMKNVLAPAFEEAERRGCPAVLDTDSRQKVMKYEHCGMKMVAEKDMGHGVKLYTMEYREK